jgi:thiol:disulfide interchange protein
MRFPKFRYAFLCGAALGLAIPLLVMSLFKLRIFPSGGTWLEYIWPSSFMLMATETLGYSLKAFAILAWSIGWNVFLYVIVFALLWLLGWVVRACLVSSRDRTTI